MMRNRVTYTLHLRVTIQADPARAEGKPDEISSDPEYKVIYVQEVLILQWWKDEIWKISDVLLSDNFEVHTTTWTCAFYFLSTNIKAEDY